MMRIRGFVIFFVGLGFLALLMNGAANWLELQPTPAKAATNLQAY